MLVRYKQYHKQCTAKLADIHVHRSTLKLKFLGCVLLSARHFCVGLLADTIAVDEVTWRTSVEKEWNSSTYHSAVSELRTTIPVELNSLPHTPNPTPQDYTTGRTPVINGVHG